MNFSVFVFSAVKHVQQVLVPVTLFAKAQIFDDQWPT